MGAVFFPASLMDIGRLEGGAQQRDPQALGEPDQEAHAGEFASAVLPTLRPGWAENNPLRTLAVNELRLRSSQSRRALPAPLRSFRIVQSGHSAKASERTVGCESPAPMKSRCVGGHAPAHRHNCRLGLQPSVRITNGCPATGNESEAALAE
jgi:hypothetical protein